MACCATTRKNVSFRIESRSPHAGAGDIDRQRICMGPSNPDWSDEAWQQRRSSHHICDVMLLESFSSIKENINKLEEKLHAEAKAREESDMVPAQNIAKLNNLLVENGILWQENSRIPSLMALRPASLHDANSVLYNCTVCMDRQRTIRLDPCGHMATCASCTEKIMETLAGSARAKLRCQGGTCPLCRVPVTRAQRTFLS